VACRNRWSHRLRSQRSVCIGFPKSQLIDILRGTRLRVPRDEFMVKFQTLLKAREFSGLHDEVPAWSHSRIRATERSHRRHMVAASLFWESRVTRAPICGLHLTRANVLQPSCPVIKVLQKRRIQSF
jgi:hypothetical protein